MHIASLFRNTVITTLLLAAPGIALAHPSHQPGADFMAGMLHPLTGLDHVLMIIAVSAWAALLPLPGRILVALCLALFVGMGALVPVSGGRFLEAAIALTVIGAGTLLAIGKRWPTSATALLAAVFALVHGFAHGAEGPGREGSYVPGLVLATSALALATCLLVGLLQERKAWLRFAGALSAGAGAAALVA